MRWKARCLSAGGWIFRPPRWNFAQVAKFGIPVLPPRPLADRCHPLTNAMIDLAGLGIQNWGHEVERCHCTNTPHSDSGHHRDYCNSCQFGVENYLCSPIYRLGERAGRISRHPSVYLSDYPWCRIFLHIDRSFRA